MLRLPANQFATRTWNRRLMAAALAMLAGLVWLSASLASPPPTAAARSPSPAVPAFRQANHVAVLSVHGVIDRVTLMSLERRIRTAVNHGADAIILDINTPGGEMFSTLEICSLLKNRSETPANLVAWINPMAYSAGTIIALACREIIMAPGSTMGDAAPIDLFGRQIAPTERAKILSPLLTEIIDSARRNHYDENLVQAFAKLGVHLWMLEHVATGERVFVDREEYRAVFGEEPPTGAAVTPSLPMHIGHSELRPRIDQTIPQVGDAASADPEALREEIEFQQTLPPVRAPLTDADRDQYRLLMQVADGTTLLTVKPDEAVFFGLATAVISNEADLQAFFGAQTISRYDQTWSEGLVRFLISWPVKAILIAIFLVCLFIELAAPGFGVFGSAAIIALLILVGAPALVGMAQWWHILLIVVGLGLIATELFLLPGFGVAGAAGILCLLVGLVGTFVSGDITTAEGRSQMWTGLLVTLTSGFLAGIIIWFISRQLHSFPLLNRLVLQTELKDPALAGAGGVGVLQAMGAPARDLQVGEIGIAETDLRPAGRAMFNGRLIDVKSAGGYIDRGTPVRIVSLGRFVIEVEEATT